MSKSIHIQARLHREKIREADACAIYDSYTKRGFTDREIVREALIAMRLQEDAGWTPEADITEPRMTREMVTILRQMHQVAQRLSTMSVGGWSQSEVQSAARELTEFEQSAKQLLGGAVFFDDEDNE